MLLGHVRALKVCSNHAGSQESLWCTACQSSFKVERNSGPYFVQHAFYTFKSANLACALLCNCAKSSCLANLLSFLMGPIAHHSSDMLVFVNRRQLGLRQRLWEFPDFSASGHVMQTNAIVIGLC